jgi:hypothetical protein
MEKINVAELLKDCPKGMELYSPIFGKVYLDKIRPHLAIVVITDKEQGDFREEFLYDGRYGMNGECMLFPSKGKTTWEGFQRPFKEGDIIRVHDEYSDASFIYLAILKQIEGELIYSHCSYSYEGSEFSTDDFLFDIYSIRFATEEEKQKLFQVIKDNGYKWNSETKTLEKLIEPKFKVGDRIRRKNSNEEYIITSINDYIYYYRLNEHCTGSLGIQLQDDFELVPNKFDITTLVPFKSEVLVRNDESQYWIPAFWGCKHADGYTTTFGWCKYCIPYSGNEHLLGTTDDCDEFYKTWK